MRTENVSGVIYQGRQIEITIFLTTFLILTGGIPEINAAEKLLGEKNADLIGVKRAIRQNSTWAESSVSYFLY